MPLIVRIPERMRGLLEDLLVEPNESGSGGLEGHHHGGFMDRPSPAARGEGVEGAASVVGSWTERERGTLVCRWGVSGGNSLGRKE